MLWICTIVVFVALTSSIATMIWCIGLPADEHIQITNRYLNWPEKECYSATDLEMIIEGP